MENQVGKFINGALEVRVLEDRHRINMDEEGKKVTIIETAASQVSAMAEHGWKPIEPIDTTQLKCEEEFHSTRIEPIEKECTIGFTYIKQLDKQLVRKEINRLKTILSDGDYKITKCYELSLLGSESPYNIQELHAQRQTVRDRINELTKLLS